MKLYIGLSICKVTERYHILQCYACQKFGHRKGTEKCQLFNTSKNICLYCSGEHTSKICSVKKQSNLFKCNNCATSTENSIRTNCMGHTTTDAKCPLLQQALKLLMNRTIGTSYRSNVPKNTITT